MYKIAFFLCVIFSLTLQSQHSPDIEKEPSGLAKALILHLDYAAGVPILDLADRFGNHLSFGAGLEYQLANNKYSIGLHSNYFFGNTVKEDVLYNYRTENGLLIGADELTTEILLKERGLYTNLYLAYKIPLQKQHTSHFLRTQLGIAFLYSKIRIQDDARAFAQINDNFKKGFDRLSGGFGISGGVYYEFRQKNNRFNCIIGLDGTIAQTQLLRNLQFDSQFVDAGNRLDGLLQLKAAWLLPVFLRKRTEEIFY